MGLMQKPDNLRLSLLEKVVVNFCGTIKYLSYRTIGDPLPNEQDELDGVVIDEDYFINQCAETIMNRKYARHAKRKAKKIESEQLAHSSYYREIN